MDDFNWEGFIRGSLYAFGGLLLIVGVVGVCSVLPTLARTGLTRSVLMLAPPFLIMMIVGVGVLYALLTSEP